jgi:hypothetical protein
MKHCISCGKKGVRWPKHDPEVCTARCAAFAFTVYAETGDWEGAHCSDCGGFGAPCEHERDCPSHPLNCSDEEGDAYYGRKEEEEA